MTVTDLEERGSSGDALQRLSLDATSPFSLRDTQLSVTHHGGGGEGVGVATTGTIAGLRGGGGQRGHEVRDAARMMGM